MRTASDLDVALDPLGFLGCVVASLPALVCRAHGLAVQNRGGGFLTLTCLYAHRIAQQVVNGLPITLFGPKSEVMVNGLPGAKVPRQTVYHYFRLWTKQGYWE